MRTFLLICTLATILVTAPAGSAHAVPVDEGSGFFDAGPHTTVAIPRGGIGVTGALVLCEGGVVVGGSGCIGGLVSDRVDFTVTIPATPLAGGLMDVQLFSDGNLLEPFDSAGDLPLGTPVLTGNPAGGRTKFFQEPSQFFSFIYTPDGTPGLLDPGFITDGVIYSITSDCAPASPEQSTCPCTNCTDTPGPATWLLLVTGSLGLFAYGWRRRQPRFRVRPSLAG